MFTFFSYTFDIHFLLNAVGVLGSLTYIAGFGMVQTRVICGNGIVYCCLQITAATCVLISLNSSFNLAFFIIQISFATIGLFGLMIKLRDRRKAHNSVRSTPPPQQHEGMIHSKSRSITA